MIRDLRLFRIFNSKGEDSVMVKLFTDKGVFPASVPSGTSAGKNEARELPFPKVKKSFSEIRKLLAGREEDFREADSLLREHDRTGNFSGVGGNLATAISIAVARAQAGGKLWSLSGIRSSHHFPLPLSNIIGGGVHHGGSEWQEFLVIPYRIRNPYEAKQAVIEVWSAVGEELRKRKKLLGRNIENAWMSPMDFEDTLEFLSEASAGWHVRLGVDIAASSFWDGKAYKYRRKSLSPVEQLELVLEMAGRFRLYYIEDPFHEEAFSSFSVLRKKAKALVVGDDLFCTSPARLAKGIEMGSASGVIIKPNQVGTLSDCEKVVEMARRKCMVPVVSHRSGETEDTWLADLGILFSSPLIKIGCLGADLPKHNRLIELWEEVPDNRMADLPDV
jgi:enolase